MAVYKVTSKPFLIQQKLIFKDLAVDSLCFHFMFHLHQEMRLKFILETFAVYCTVGIEMQ